MALTYFAPTPLAGMCAIVQGGGVSFRVWAPNARGVTLGGDFLTAGATSPASWTELPMARNSDTGEGGAYWSIFVKDAVADSLYKFKIDNPNVPSETASNGYWPYHHDPYAKDATAFSTRCLVPEIDGAYFSERQKEALWDRFFTGAPARQRQSVERYNIVKRA